MRLLIGIAAAAAASACGGGSDGGNEAGGGKAGGSAGAAMQPGQWEMTTTVTRMNVPGMPAGVNPTPPPNTSRTCLTAEDVRENANFVSESAGEGCTSQNASMSGGRIQATIQCNRPEGQMSMTMDGQYTPTTLALTQQIRTSMAGGQNVEMDARMTGRRIGDCPAGSGETK